MKNLRNIIFLPLFLLLSCAHMQIGNLIIKTNNKITDTFPIRQIKLFNKNYCLKHSKDWTRCEWYADNDICIDYTDVNKNGEYDPNIDISDKELAPCKFGNFLFENYISSRHIQVKESHFKFNNLRFKYKKHQKPKRVPILQLLLYEKGHCLKRNKNNNCLTFAKKNVCVSFIDYFKNGFYDWKRDPLRDGADYCKHPDDLGEVYPLERHSSELTIVK